MSMVCDVDVKRVCLVCGLVSKHKGSCFPDIHRRVALKNRSRVELPRVGSHSAFT
jgi:hypothetical protein